MTPDELRAALQTLGWSQVRLAERLGVHKNTVSLWARGKAEIPGPAVAYLNLALRVAALMYDEDE